jgi:hypothetical protein
MIGMQARIQAVYVDKLDGSGGPEGGRNFAADHSDWLGN